MLDSDRLNMVKTPTTDVIHSLTRREIAESSSVPFQRKLHVNDSMVMRLGLEKELSGHTGCVNCLEWNESGTLLASGSDDIQIILWDPFKHKKVHSIQSGHHGNIFSVKFMPKSNDRIIVSGAADFKIRVHDIGNSNGAGTTHETTMVCSCHAGRVKRLAVAPNVPFMFWSAAEDGFILQYDLRTPHHCSGGCNNVLINLINHIGRNAEAKCIAINPLRPELLAVGANDPYVRLYDRRMISPTSIKYPTDHAPRSPWERHNYMASYTEPDEDNLPPGCVTYFVAGHLPLKQTDYKKRYRTLASTYLAFSPDGAEIVANLGGEQIYLFDINKPNKPKTFDLLHKLLDSGGSHSANGYSTTNGFCKDGLSINGYKNGTNGVTTKSYRRQLPLRVELVKTRANESFGRQQYTLAISLYNQALSMCPDAAVIYGNRAAALMKRGWDGDVYAALRDCFSAVKLDPEYGKAYFRLASCLYELRWNQEASECLQLYKSKFPDLAKSRTYEALDRDIKAAIFSRNDHDTEDGNKSDSQGSSSTSSSSTTTGGGEGSGGSNQHSSSPRCCKSPLSEQEKSWRSLAFDYSTRYCGHCNTTTDIKEANFFGSASQYIIAGSDDGSFFIWNRATTNIVRVLRGDDAIVNCLQPHPSTCLLATSGIDPVVRLWSPRPEDGSRDDREVLDSEDAAVANQKRMNADPLEIMLMNMGYRIPGVLDGEEIDTESREANVVQCRPS